MQCVTFRVWAFTQSPVSQVSVAPCVVHLCGWITFHCVHAVFCLSTRRWWTLSYFLAVTITVLQRAPMCKCLYEPVFSVLLLFAEVLFLPVAADTKSGKCRVRCLWALLPFWTTSQCMTLFCVFLLRDTLSNVYCWFVDIVLTGGSTVTRAWRKCT